MHYKIFFTILSIVAVTPVLSQTDTGRETFVKMLKLKNNLYMLQSDGGNIGINIGKDGIFMVDDYFTEDVAEIQEQIKKINDKPVRFVVNTHFHKDHTAGNPILAKEGAIIISHEAVRPRLQLSIKEGTKKISEDILPVITFKNELRIHFNNEEIEIFHAPNAHTDGDAMVYFMGSNVLQTGDIFVNGEYPFIDVENGGSVNGYIEGIQRALSKINKDTKIIPGHGPVATYKDLAETGQLLATTSKRISQLILMGKTEDQVLGMKELLEPFTSKGFSDGFITGEVFLKTLYQDAHRGRTDKEERIKENEEARLKYEKIKKQQEANSKKG